MSDSNKSFHAIFSFTDVFHSKTVVYCVPGRVGI